jgi:hypothetical protein
VSTELDLAIVKTEKHFLFLTRMFQRAIKTARNRAMKQFGGLDQEMLDFIAYLEEQYAQEQRRLNDFGAAPDKESFMSAYMNETLMETKEYMMKKRGMTMQ